MTSPAIIFLVGIVLLQGSFGSPRTTDGIVKRYLGEEITQLQDATETIKRNLQDIQARMAEVKADKQRLQERFSSVEERCKADEELSKHMTVLKSWDFDSCVDFSDAFVAAENTLVAGAQMAWNVSVAIGNVLMDLLNCPGINPITAIKCYNRDFGRLKDTILENKTKMKNYLATVKSVLNDVRYDFDKCVGLPTPSNVFLETYLNELSHDCINKY